MLAHNRLNGLGCLVGVVERDRGYKMVENVGLDDAVEQVTTDEAKLTIDRRGRSASEIPGVRFVVRQCRISVLEESDCDCEEISGDQSTDSRGNHLPSQ